MLHALFTDPKQVEWIGTNYFDRISEDLKNGLSVIKSVHQTSEEILVFFLISENYYKLIILGLKIASEHCIAGFDLTLLECCFAS